MFCFDFNQNQRFILYNKKKVQKRWKAPKLKPLKMGNGKPFKTRFYEHCNCIGIEIFFSSKKSHCMFRILEPVFNLAGCRHEPYKYVHLIWLGIAISCMTEKKDIYQPLFIAFTMGVQKGQNLTQFWPHLHFALNLFYSVLVQFWPNFDWFWTQE